MKLPARISPRAAALASGMVGKSEGAVAPPDFSASCNNPYILTVFSREILPYSGWAAYRPEFSTVISDRFCPD